MVLPRQCEAIDTLDYTLIPYCFVVESIITRLQCTHLPKNLKVVVCFL